MGEKVDGKGERKNSGKLPLELVPVSTATSLAKVLQVGAAKYAPNNWRRGMSWNTVIACMERHLLKLKAGEDFDEESGLRHVEHVLANAAFLNEYYYTCPELDDRYKNSPEDIQKMFSTETRTISEESKSITVGPGSTYSVVFGNGKVKHE